jgi:type IV pilus assembly protein PilB
MHEEIGLTFAYCIEVIPLRQDPDIILVGEIRDFETAEIGIKVLARQGILCSQHSIPMDAHHSTINKTSQYGNRTFLPGASSVTSIVAQRLARKSAPSARRGTRRNNP